MNAHGTGQGAPQALTQMAPLAEHLLKLHHTQAAGPSLRRCPPATLLQSPGPPKVHPLKAHVRAMSGRSELCVTPAGRVPGLRLLEAEKEAHGTEWPPAGTTSADVAEEASASSASIRASARGQARSAHHLCVAATTACGRPGKRPLDQQQVLQAALCAHPPGQLPEVLSRAGQAEEGSWCPEKVFSSRSAARPP